MGRGDNRRTLKMRRRAGQRRKKEQHKKLRQTLATKSSSTPPPLKTPTAARAKSDKVTIKRSGQRKTTTATQS